MGDYRGFGARQHAWNYDPDLGLYIDLSQDQFFFKYKKIILLPEDTHILKQNSDKTNEHKHLRKINFRGCDIDEIIESLLSDKRVFEIQAKKLPFVEAYVCSEKPKVFLNYTLSLV